DSIKTSVDDLSIRVNVNVLDSLMDLVGELVLTRNQLLQLSRGDDESKYAAPITHLNRVTTDLQEGVMKTRMQPIGNAWNKLPRLVRDLAQVTGHQIELEMSGADTELDRTVLDAIKDPLTHMVRNSADHGIESPEERRAKGKPEIGKIKLNAFHEGGHVIISIEDDGAGINTEKVLQKAVKSGMLSQSDAANLSHNEIISLVFKAGLSTVEEVSSVSGRGVGMDVVKTSIERIGGTVDITSVENQGTSVRIKIPLTLAIISALVVESGGESFAIPQLGVVELVRLAAEDRHKIERIHDKEVFRLRDRLLPMMQLSEILELEDSPEDDQRDINIVVVQVGDEQFGLTVSEVFDTEEIVVKPVGRLLKDISIYQGTTILGDGRVIMILDVAGIAMQFGGLSTSSSDSETKTENESDKAGDTTSLLLFDSGNNTTMSVPLSLVARLEEFPRESIERNGDKLVVQYRGDLLPLLPLNGSNLSNDIPELQPVIVFSEGRSSMGLMVEKIQDILDEQLLIRMHSDRTGVLGTAIINGKATDVIDTQHYIMTANPEWFVRNEEQRDCRILVIDDSMFFRQLVTTSLESEEYNVVSAESAIQAVEMIEHGERFDVIISDLEMPMMDGYEFAEWFKERPEGKSQPMIALSIHSGSAVESRAIKSGFDRYLTKFNAQQLFTAIEELSLERANNGAHA
ncbi:MAG: chemotaxis protein CheW, partial [Planctomycetes bacterium]|nr:chemotaxis protein CheW [Planctomycetota bacterium]